MDKKVILTFKVDFYFMNLLTKKCWYVIRYNLKVETNLKIKFF